MAHSSGQWQLPAARRGLPALCPPGLGRRGRSSLRQTTPPARTPVLWLRCTEESSPSSSSRPPACAEPSGCERKAGRGPVRRERARRGGVGSSPPAAKRSYSLTRRPGQTRCRWPPPRPRRPLCRQSPPQQSPCRQTPRPATPRTRGPPAAPLLLQARARGRRHRGRAALRFRGAPAIRYPSGPQCPPHWGRRRRLAIWAGSAVNQIKRVPCPFPRRLP